MIGTFASFMTFLTVSRVMLISTVFAQLAQPAAASDSSQPRSNWAPVVLLILIGIGFAVGNLIASIVIGPSRTGDVKSGTYESGMVPVGDTRRRFNVRFYIVAMIFLVIDVEIVFFYPWATIFSPVIQTGSRGQPTVLLV